jgi:hypothetical protein
LHHSDDPNNRTVAVTCYLDESGTDNQGPVAVAGGLLLNKTNCLHFDEEWKKLLDHYDIDNRCIHMKDFRTKNKHLSPRSTRGLFLGVVDLINSHKYASIAATINHDQFKKLVHEEIREHVGMHFFCFLLCAFQNHMQAEYMKFNERIAFLLEQPCEHGDEILAAHKAIIIDQETKEFHMGTIGFADKKISALQAADVIAWGVRRRISGLSFPFGFEPILKILESEDHLQDKWQDDAFIALSEWAEKEIDKERKKISTLTEKRGGSGVKSLRPVAQTDFSVFVK